MTARVDPGAVQQVDPELLSALAAPAMYRGRPEVSVYETHASWVFVAGDRAFKVKKPVSLGFLDYGTLARRRSACREEVRVNRELAPGLYLGVRAIVRGGPAGFRLARDDARSAVEYAVEMRSFSEQDTFAGLIAAGSLTRADVAAVARLLADFHRSADVASDWGPERVLDVWRANVGELTKMRHPSGWRLDVAATFGEAFVAGHALELRRRALLGLARDGHGDLRCEHVLARPTVGVVDRIEFDPQLRRTDVACDLAFLAMDLEARGQRWAARELVGAYRHAGVSPGGEALRSFYAAHWALVRAKVALIAAAGHAVESDAAGTGSPASAGSGGDARADADTGADADTSRDMDTRASTELEQAQRLWSLSERLCWRARAPLAIVICGPAASGKSTLAAELARRSEMPVVSSDAVRKRLAGLDEHEPARGEHYSHHFTRATYEQLARDALLALRRSDSVIVDATCRTREDRVLLLDRLRRFGMTRLIVRCEVPLELALRRAARRMHDPGRISDATPRIVEEQFRSFEELDERSDGDVLRLDTTEPLDMQLAALARAVDRGGSARGVAAVGTDAHRG
jgi:aminoglycoside phosphotransferase family enzyme/predicted kinase